MPVMKFMNRLLVYFGSFNGGHLSMDEKSDFFSDHRNYEALIRKGNCVGSAEVIIYSTSRLTGEKIRSNLEQKLNGSEAIVLIQQIGDSTPL